MVRNLESIWKWKKAEEHRAVSFCLIFDVTARTTTPIVGGERLQCRVTCIKCMDVGCIANRARAEYSLAFLVLLTRGTRVHYAGFWYVMEIPNCNALAKIWL